MTPAERTADLRSAAKRAKGLLPTAGVRDLLASFLAEAVDECDRLRRVLTCEWCIAAETGAGLDEFRRVGEAHGHLHRLTADDGREVTVACWAGHPSATRKAA